MSLRTRLTAPGPKRILALDGGGLRGAITLGYLAEIERLLRDRHGRPDLRLRDYFDLIGGTSTGSVIATQLARGSDVSTLREQYLRLGPVVFSRRRRGVKRARALFQADPLQRLLKEFVGKATLGDPEITTGLCIVTKRADTRSTWPLLNHPDGKYYEANKDILLAAAIRASTAAPVVFQPEAVDVGGGEVGAFIDGGVSIAKNPALLLFIIATASGFHFEWRTGEDELLLVSIGTGYWSDQVSTETVLNRKVWNWAMEVPGLLLEDAGRIGEIMLQYLSRTPTGRVIDTELGDLATDLLTEEPLLSYLRYDVKLDPPTLRDYGLARFGGEDIGGLRDMTRADRVEDMMEVGRIAAAHQVEAGHFPVVFDV